MINSIQQFCQDGAHRLTDIFGKYTSDLTKIVEMVYDITDEVTKLGCWSLNFWQTSPGKHLPETMK